MNTHPPAMYCKTCGDPVQTAQMREHLEGHNPNARSFEWEQILDCFTRCKP